MVKPASLLLLFAAIVTAATAALAAPRGYAFRPVVSVEVVEPGGHTPLEDKNYLDCRDFKVSDADVRYALRHARPVSARHWSDGIASVGCYVGVRVTYDNGERSYVAIEPTGRVLASPEPPRYAGRSYYYECKVCASRSWGVATPSR